MSKSLQEMAEEVYDINVAAGWQPSSNTFGDCMALLHSEVSEALEAWRNYGLADIASLPEHRQTCPMNGLEDKMPTLGQRNSCNCGALPRPEGVGSEFADVLIRLLDNCKMYGIDLEAEYERKVAYNRTRAWRHGGKRL